MKRLILATLIALLATLGTSAFAQDEQTPAIPPQDALRHAAQLRAEASAHRKMERQLAARTGGSRGERRWRKTMIALCREYSATAERTAHAYERAAAADTTPSSPELRAHATLPVTPAEYDATAARYEAQAASLRADADRHLSMLRSSRNADLQQPYYGSRGLGQWRTGTWIETPQQRAAREHCQDIAQMNFELARDADDIAKHYRLRARQLEAMR